MNKSNDKFCPDWLYKIIVSQTVYDYIVRDVAFFISSKKFISFFSEYYDEITVDEIEGAAVAFIQFLGEVKTKDPFLLLNHFIYSIITDVNPNAKGIFKKDVYQADNKKKYSPHVAVKDFKIFSFSCRSGLTKTAPLGWDLKNEQDLGLITEALNKEFSIDDMIDSVI
ncbi:MAG: hypothetical protein ACJ0G4_00165 [Alphaproteobacteria bacterium]